MDEHGSASYTRGEVAWLLGLSREDAVLSDAVPRSSANLNGNETSASLAAYDETLVSTVVRWSEVHGARRRVIARRLADDGLDADEVRGQLVIAVLRSWGLTGPEVAEVVGMDRFVAERRFRGLIGAVLEELGGEAPAIPMRLDAPAPACLRCGSAPRVRSSMKVRRIVDGRRRRVTIERQTSLCAACLEEASAPGPTEVRGSLRDLRTATGEGAAP